MLDFDDKDTQARDVLTRFGPQLRWTVQSVVTSFRLRSHQYTELRQEAEILVVTYAGLMVKQSWGNGRLAKWTETANGDEQQVKHLLAKQLRIDLSQIVSRQIDHNAKEAQLMSLDGMVDTETEPADEDWEYREILRIDSQREGKRLYRLFPTLTAYILDDYSQAELAQTMRVTTRTVRNKLVYERRAYLIDYLYRQGIKTANTDSDDELAEAASYAFRARRIRE